MGLFALQIDKVHTLDSIVLSKGEFGKVLEEYISSKEYYIYFLCKRKKVRYVISECATLKGSLKIWIKSDFKTSKKNFRVTPTSQIQGIHLAKSTTKCLRIITNKGDANLTTSAYITDKDIDLSVPPEIMYIGKSNDIKARLENHEKIIQLFASLGDNEELTFNLVKPSFGWGNEKESGMIHFNLLTTELENEFKFTFDQMVDFTERLLINYYKPELNNHFTKDVLAKDCVLEKLKSKFSIDKIALFIDLTGYNYQFWSKNQVVKKAHLILNSDFDFEEFEMDKL